MKEIFILSEEEKIGSMRFVGLENYQTFCQEWEMACKRYFVAKTKRRKPPREKIVILFTTRKEKP